MSAKYKKSVRKLAIVLSCWAIGMFGFGYALVPLYNVMCKNLGLNGKTSNQVSPLAVSAIDMSRTVSVQFLATNNANLQWKFHPYRTSVVIHPGENTRIAYYAKNETDKTMTVQAIPSVTPGIAAKYLKKTECFCFRRQTLKSKESLDMPVLFHLDRDLPKNIETVTLSYTLFDVTTMKKPRDQTHVIQRLLLTRP